MLNTRKDLFSIMGLNLAGSSNVNVGEIQMHEELTSSINKSVSKRKANMILKRASVKSRNIKKHGRRSR